MSDMIRKFTEPGYLGPGIWFVIHLMAIRAKDFSRKLHFIEMMKTLCDNHKCLDCRAHCAAYIKNNPIEKEFQYRDPTTGEDAGMFVWSWRFHNEVNRRLGKPVMDYNSAYHLYSNPDMMVCEAGCDEGSKEKKQEKTFRLVTRKY